MSTVNQAGSVFEVSSLHSFLRKNFDLFMRSRAGPVTEISVTGMKIFPKEHSSPISRDKAF